MARHWMFLTAVGFLLGFFVIFGVWWLYGRLVHSSGPRGQLFRRKFMRFRNFMGKDGASYELVESEDHNA